MKTPELLNLIDEVLEVEEPKLHTLQLILSNEAEVIQLGGFESPEEPQSA